MLKSALSISLVLAVLLVGTCVNPAYAQGSDVYQVYRLPEPAFLEPDAAGHGYMCYDEEGFRKLLTVDNALRLSEGRVPRLEAAVQELMLESKALRKALVLADSSKLVLKVDRDRIHAKWVEANRKFHIADNRPTFGTWVPWAISGVLLVVGGSTISVLVLTGD